MDSSPEYFQYLGEEFLDPPRVVTATIAHLNVMSTMNQLSDHTAQKRPRTT